jgi:hypothetical protein
MSSTTSTIVAAGARIAQLRLARACGELVLDSSGRVASDAGSLH